ncbi:MAG: hypothetical protein IT328_04635 [Caldilineaceae bacterium]|nr:hypothetical protein [Caldilineaceae bacterium]
MLRLYQTAEKTGQRPSALIDLDDAYTALDFDNAVIYAGRTLESAAQEQERVGSGPTAQWRHKYPIEQLLDPNFRLPSPKTKQFGGGLLALMAMASNPRSGVKLWRVAKPDDGRTEGADERAA